MHMAMKRGVLAGVAGLAVLGVVAGRGAFADQPAPMASPMFVAGYLPRGAVPDGLKLNPPPPAAGSGALARDEEAAKAALALHGTARWELARRDADLATPGAIGLFSCAAGFAIGPQTTPKVNALLRKMAPDLGLATYPTKRFYMRARPFTVNGQPMCTPEMDGVLRHDGSYPSGHSAIGYGWGLVLAELIPERVAELVARGRAFGDSRRVCNVHWLSDVEEGRVEAGAVVARLHAEAGFRADLEAARAELAGLKDKVAATGCEAEAAALGMK